MKRCQNCNDMALYEDTEMTCPICRSALVRYPMKTGIGADAAGQQETPQGRRVITANAPQLTERRTRQSVIQDGTRSSTDPPSHTEDQSQRPQRAGRRVVNPVGQGDSLIRDEPEFSPDHDDRGRNRRNVRTGTSEPIDTRRNGAPQFDERIGRREHIFRGRVAEVSSHSRYYNRFHKFVNMVSRREPFQFGNASYETVIRIEEFTNSHLPSQFRDLVIYGDVEGQVHVGDDVTVHAVQSGGRYVVRGLHNNQTESDVTPGPQMSVLVGVLLAAVVIAVFASILYGIYAFFTKGGFDALLMALVNLVIAILVKLLPLFFLFIIFKLLLGIGRGH